MVRRSDKSINWVLIRNYIEYFLIYCFLGWLYESIWCDVIYHRRGFLNRGFLWGPWLPIYGIGFFIIFGILTLLKIKKPIMVFISGTIIATSAELIASYILEMTTVDYMWDYTEVRQFQLIQNSKNEYLIRLNVYDNFEREKDLISTYKLIFGSEAIIQIEYVDEIPVLNSGKRRYIINNYK